MERRFLQERLEQQKLFRTDKKSKSYGGIKRMEKYKVAVASSDGKTVDTHFGHAQSFLIFEVDTSKYH